MAGLARVTGAPGLVTFILLFAPVIAVSTLGEPPFVATGEDIRAF